MKLYNEFIGNDERNSMLYFVGGDDEERFKKNLSIMPDDWYYRTHQITYNYNKFGHRCKNIEEIDLDNYIIFSGCSHTEGTGLELETTYPFLVSKMLQCDYYNLAIPASGQDVLVYNVLSWYFKVPKKPRLIMIQWPDHSRFASYDKERKNFLERGSWMEDQYVRDFIVDAENSGFFNARKKLGTLLVSNIVKDVPIIKFNFSGQKLYDSDNMTMRKLDLARDQSHSGIKSHKKFSEILYTAASNAITRLPI